MTDQRRQLAQAAYHSGARVLVILTDGEQVIGHIAGMISRGFTLLVRHPSGRVERLIVWDRVDSIDVTDEADVPIEDSLFQLGLELLRRANEETQKSLAERMLEDHREHHDDQPA